jgi:acid phosphatase
MRSFRFLVPLLPALAFSVACATRTPLPPPGRNPHVQPLSVNGVSRVVVIVLENGKPSNAAQQPFMQRRAAEGMTFTNFFGVAHPSQPNYIAMISGSTQDALTDRPITLTRPHLGKLLKNRWRVYADDYPAEAGKCALVAKKCLYARRHIPFLSFDDVQKGNCSQIVTLNRLHDPVGALRDDIDHQSVPALALIIPNVLHDGHEPHTVVDANKWLVANIEPLLTRPEFTTGTVFVLTYDEDDTRGKNSNKIFTVIWGDHVQQGTSDDVYNHFDLYVTIAALLGVTPDKPPEEADARPIGGIWK